MNEKELLKKVFELFNKHHDNKEHCCEAFYYKDFYNDLKKLEQKINSK